MSPLCKSTSMRVTNYLETELITVSVWEQHQYDAPLVDWQASQGHERQLSVAVRSIWEAPYIKFEFYSFDYVVELNLRG